MTSIRVLGVELRAQRYAQAIDDFIDVVRRDERRRAHFCTVHTLVESRQSPALLEALGSAWMVCMDGVPLVWVSKLRGVQAERVCGPDVMLTICDRGRELGLRHFFLGGASGTPERLAAAMTARFPGLAVAGTLAPPFRALTEDEDAAVVEAVNAAKPDVVWIGLGSPKQELWSADHEARLNCHLVLPVGAAFDFHSGRLRRAPRWMRGLGLEWLFRLAMEPRRLFRRYVVTNARFVFLITREEIGRRLGRRARAP
jgi:N-acetylglucosaminyldiphosphoundecaprenol N-acetyl-beta-D-mannosaminyltransferase